MRTALLTMIAAATLLAGCSIEHDKDSNGRAKSVDIKTPFGSLEVNKGKADPKEIGVALYPNARPVADEPDEEHNANVNISTAAFGLKVIAAAYETDDAPDKVLAFYRNELKSRGPITECKGNVNFRGPKDKREPFCTGNDDHKKTNLVVGTEGRQRIVSVEPKGNGSKFALVYVQTRGEPETM